MADYVQIADPATGAARTDRILRRTDGATVFRDAGSAAWSAYQAWCEAGSVPDPPPPWTPPPRAAASTALRDALKATGQSSAWQTALAGESPDTRDWWSSHYNDRIAIDAVKLVRIAGKCVPPVDLNKLYTAAGA